MRTRCHQKYGNIFKFYVDRYHRERQQDKKKNIQVLNQWQIEWSYCLWELEVVSISVFGGLWVDFSEEEEAVVVQRGGFWVDISA